MGTISADIIILAFVAGFILYKLFSILGQRDDDGFSHSSTKTNNMIDISYRVQDEKEETQEISETEKALSIGFEKVLLEIKAFDPRFSLEKFMNGAKKAFEMILTAFAENDLKTLDLLLDSKTLSQFVKEIEKRNKNNISLSLTLVSLPIVKIKDIRLTNQTATIDVYFQSQQITLLKDKNGTIVDGNVNQVDNVDDTWTFSKNLTSKENWRLIKVSTD